MKILKKFDVYAGLPKSIYILFICRTVNALGNFIYPFLTLFLTGRLGLSAKTAGAFVMMNAVCQGAGSIVGGKLSDKHGRKKLFILFQGIAAICLVPCAFLGNSMWIPKLLMLSGFFTGAGQPINSAMATDLTNAQNRKAAFSLLYLGTNIGFAVGPTIAGLLYRKYTNWIFFGNVFAITITLILFLLYIEETMPNEERVEESVGIESAEAAEEGSIASALIKRPTLLFFVFGRLVNSLVYSSIGFVIPLQMAKIYGENLGAARFGYLMSFTGVVITICTIPLTKLTIKVRSILTVFYAGIFYAIGFGMLGFANTYLIFLLSAFIFTLGEILDVTGAGVYIANNTPITHRGRFNAILPLISGAGFATGPYIFGRIIEVCGIPTSWLICFILSACTSGFMKWLDAFENRRKERNLSNENQIM